ncbi:MAG: TetR/AcrR family transcriptional regulator [Streptosporangiaceae bacterium]|jgi:AcrR family transcriptional regulator
MPRVPARDRLSEIAAVATEHFGRLGYRATKTADVAAKAGMSTGSLFTYVESKKALFHLVFLHWFEMSSERLPILPLATPGEGETLRLIEAGLRRVQMPRIRAALVAEEPAEVAEELREVIEERYALLEHYWPLFAVIERCAVEMPALEAAWFGLARAGIYEELSRYLERRMAAGLLRPMPDPEVAARLVNESLSWFAWHRREGRDANLYDDAVGKRTVVEFICAALVPHTVGETAACSLGPHNESRDGKKRDPQRKGPSGPFSS